MINSISKTEQLKELVLRDIKRGIYKPGAALPSIQEFCNRCKVSKHTVSQALSNLGELGFIDTAPGKITRVRASLPSFVVDVLYAGTTPLSRQAFWSEVYGGMLSILSARQIGIREFSLGGMPSGSVDLTKSRGAIALGTLKDEILTQLERHSVPCVHIYDHPAYGGSCVDSCLEMSIDAMIGLLVSNGARRLVYIDRFHAEDGQSLNALKWRCLMSCVKARNAECSYIPAKPGMGDAYAAVKELVRTGTIDGIVLSSDFLAPGVYRALHDSGLRIPVDVKVASFDNLELAGFMIPSLSSIDLRRYEAGERAALKLLDIMDGGGLVVNAQESLEAEFVQRESLG